ncbi:hypothetical protein HUW46_05764 [Amycolatopsis sp. CA-230715]|nr:hypothetical protein HUW46_05764 [Amycolatopsis sp. CA-230715]
MDILLEEDAIEARSHARRLRAIAHIAHKVGRRRAVDRIAKASRITKSAADRRVGLALALTTYLPHTLAAMEAGLLDEYKASKVFEATSYLEEVKAREVDALVVERIAGKNPSELRRVVNSLVLQIDRQGYEERRRIRRAQRMLRIIHRDHASSSLVARLPMEQALALYNACDEDARTAKKQGDSRTLDQLRADALVKRCLVGVALATNPPTGRPPRLLRLQEILGGKRTRKGDGRRPGGPSGPSRFTGRSGAPPTSSAPKVMRLHKEAHTPGYWL